jgi:tripartite-type tricarboxylate transporter receptor subunit TctC
MPLARFDLCMLWLSLMICGAGVACAQEYPNKPIRIVTGSPGGGTDLTARLIAQGISGPLGQTVIVDNRGGPLPPEIVSQAAPDGYVLLYDGDSFILGPLMEKMSYDPVKDFSPVIAAVSTINLIVVHPSLVVNSVRELIDLAKARPGALNYGSGPTGAAANLAAEYFKVMTGVNIVRINYKGTGPAVSALIGGEVQLVFATPAVVLPHMKSGRLRALAVTSREPSAMFPGLPAVAASVPGYEAVSLYGLFAPATTPAAHINRLNQEIVRFLKTEAAQERILSAGLEVVGSSPQEFAVAMKFNIAKWSKVIKAAGIRSE